MDVNQELVPDDFTDRGVGWEILGTFDITGTTLVVELSDDANEFVIADGLRIESVGEMSPSVTITETPGPTDIFTNIDLKAYVDGANYNFGERPLGGTVQSEQTATIDFWAGKEGRELLKSLNGGKGSKQLGDWLAATFPNMYQDLAGKGNMNVAQSFRQMSKKAMAKDNEVLELKAQTMATAMAVYVTNSNLAGYTARDYGFVVSSKGVGASKRNVGTSGVAFGVADDTEMSVMDLLLAANEQTQDGTPYYVMEDVPLLRSLANDIFKAINEMGA